jgi:Putative peptidoglycan binding domain/Glycosyl hydrolase family 46
MARLLFKKPNPGIRGVRGQVVIDIQTALGTVGHPVPVVDGVYGSDTESAIKAFQATKGLPPTGQVDDVTYQQLTAQSISRLFNRCLQITGDYEGTGFSLANGNFDGAGITWGIVGFTLSNGELSTMLKQIDQQFPDVFNRSFGALASQMRKVLGQSLQQQMRFADSISIGNGSRLQPEWAEAFRKLGADPNVQDIQMQRVTKVYKNKADTDAHALGLTEEMSLALCFDRTRPVVPEVLVSETAPQLIPPLYYDRQCRQIIPVKEQKVMTGPHRRHISVFFAVFVLPLFLFSSVLAADVGTEKLEITTLAPIGTSIAYPKDGYCRVDFAGAALDTDRDKLRVLLNDAPPPLPIAWSNPPGGPPEDPKELHGQKDGSRLTLWLPWPDYSGPTKLKVVSGGVSSNEVVLNLQQPLGLVPRVPDFIVVCLAPLTAVLLFWLPIALIKHSGAGEVPGSGKHWLVAALFLDKETATYSLSKFQFYMWTAVGLISYVLVQRE